MGMRKALFVKSLGELRTQLASVTATNASHRYPTDIPDEEIRTSINLPYVESTSEELRRILRSHKIRSTFYTESTLNNLLCEPKV